MLQPLRTPDAPLDAGEQQQAPTERRFCLAIATAVALGALVRATYAFSADFPLNDGGLFYLMSADLTAWPLLDIVRSERLTCADEARLPAAGPGDRAWRPCLKSSNAWGPDPLRTHPFRQAATRQRLN